MYELQIPQTYSTNARSMPDLTSLLVKFGAEPSSLRMLDDDGPGLLPYATIVAARRNGDSALGAVEAVYEWQGAPLVFLVAADSLEDEGQLRRIRRLLAMRGDAPYLAVVAPGSLEVYRVALDKKSPGQARVDWQDEDIARSAVFARLGNVRPKASISPQNWISNVVLRLLTGSTRDLTNRGVPDDDAISLVGRALFTRFLADRSLLPDDMSGTKAERLFDSRDEAEETSKWLDDKFNGDLLPLAPDIFEMLPEGSYGVLGNILRRAPDRQLFLGWEQKWGNLHFAHIPVGVLSQAYESYLKDRAPVRQRRQGVYYTPKPIAELMVRASFRALERRGIAKSAKILDQIIVAQINDNRQSWVLDADGRYARVTPACASVDASANTSADASERASKGFSCHTYFMTNPSLSGRGSALYGRGRGKGRRPPADLSPPGSV